MMRSADWKQVLFSTLLFQIYVESKYIVWLKLSVSFGVSTLTINAYSSMISVPTFVIQLDFWKVLEVEKAEAFGQ